MVQSIILMKNENTCQWKIEKCFVKSLLQTSQMIKEWHRHALKIGTLLPFQFSILKKRK